MIHVAKTRRAVKRDRESGELREVLVDARVSRFVSGTDGVEYVVTIAPTGIVIREKGRRTAYTYPYALLHQRAGMIVADAIRGERTQRRRQAGRGLLRGRGSRTLARRSA